MSSRKSEILHFYGLLCLNHVQFQLKSTEELSLMTLKSDVKFNKKLTCSFKHDIRNLVNFHPITRKFENFTSMGSFYQKYKGLRQKHTQRSYLSSH